jgi:hypothetical protein
MAFYIQGIEKVLNRYEPIPREGVATIYMDSSDDVADLPGADRFYETSIAYDTSAGEVYILMSEGWVKQSDSGA